MCALSNDVPMSAPNQSNGRPSTPDAGLGVLSNLPRTRPQRSSSRRAAARKATATAEAASERKPKARSKAKAKAQPSAQLARTTEPKIKPKAKAKPRAVPRKPAASATRTPLVKTATSTKTGKPPHKALRRASARVDESVPRQGFESDMDRASGPVQPPGGTELVATAAEIVSELAKAGISTGERLLKDLLGHLPL
jgi:hypothetical protein